MPPSTFQSRKFVDMAHEILNLKCPFHSFTIGAVTTLAIWQVFRLLNKPTVPQIERLDVDSRYSDSIKYGNLVFVCGQVNTSGENIEEQTRSALSYVDKALEKAGTDKSKILDVTIFLADIDQDYDGMNKVYDSWILPGKPPCRACVQAKLAAPSYRVEFKVVAAT